METTGVRNLCAVDPDLIITNGILITMNERREIIADGEIAIAGTEIVRVGSRAELSSQWPSARVIDAQGGAVTPGLINAHQHVTGDPLIWSAIPDTLSSHAAIFDWAVPTHVAETSADEELGAALVGVASLRCGVTMLVEPGTVADTDAVVRGLGRVGIRAGVGTWGWDRGDGPLSAPAAIALQRIADLLDRYPAGGMYEAWVTLVGHDLASDELLVGAAELARSRDRRMTMHLSPTAADGASYLVERGVRPFIHLRDLGVLGPHLLVAHGVWIDDDEVEAILTTRTALAYCPWAYLRLGQGVTHEGRHAEIYRRGGRIALGCDASNAGDLPDILRTAALAAGLAKDQRSDPGWFSAHDALELATIAGAEAIGMAARLGSLEEGKQADIVVFNSAGVQWASPGDPVQKLVWSSDGRDVRHVLVGGKVVVEDQRCTLVDENRLSEEASDAALRLVRRAGLDVRSRWEVRGEHPEL
jgi:5-methylthioadenosine/S-adenosylhomocysteine deaminase